jgi:exonuclease I
MEGYIIRLRNLVIHARKVSKFDRLFEFNFFEFNSEIEFEEFRKSFPYANCVKYDLYEQIFSKNPRKTMKKKLREEVIKLKQVKLVLRDISIDKLLNK